MLLVPLPARPFLQHSTLAITPPFSLAGKEQEPTTLSVLTMQFSPVYGHLTIQLTTNLQRGCTLSRGRNDNSLQ